MNWIKRIVLSSVASQIARAIRNHPPSLGAAVIFRANGTIDGMAQRYATITSSKTDDRYINAVDKAVSYFRGQPAREAVFRSVGKTELAAGISLSAFIEQIVEEATL